VGVYSLLWALRQRTNLHLIQIKANENKMALRQELPI